MPKQRKLPHSFCSVLPNIVNTVTKCTTSPSCFGAPQNQLLWPQRDCRTADSVGNPGKMNLGLSVSLCSSPSSPESNRSPCKQGGDPGACRRWTTAPLPSQPSQAEQLDLASEKPVHAPLATTSWRQGRAALYSGLGKEVERPWQMPQAVQRGARGVGTGRRQLLQLWSWQQREATEVICATHKALPRCCRTLLKQVLLFRLQLLGGDA